MKTQNIEKLTKVDKMLNFVPNGLTTTQNKLCKLVAEDKLTGEDYDQYNLYENEHFQWHYQFMQRACRASIMTRYIQHRVTSEEVDRRYAEFRERYNQVVTIIHLRENKKLGERIINAPQLGADT